VSAVILAVIVIMWAVVLVPMWLRRHDAATESRSVDRFSAAMRVLSRRQPASGTARYVLMPRRQAAAAVHVSGAAAPRPARTVAAPKAPRRRPSLAVRRRRVLLALLGVASLTFVLALAGVVSWVLQLVIDLIVVSFVVHLRTQARRSAALARDRRRPSAGRPPVAAPATPTAARYAARLARAMTPAPAAVQEPAVEVAEEPVAAEVEASSEVASAAATGTDDESAWEPVPVPPPTYTMKPPAPPRHYPPVRPDSNEVGWPGVGDEAVAARAEAPVEAGDDGELDEILTRRWAVND